MKTILITGANRGIGFETARQLAVLKHRVLLTSRDAQKGKLAVQQLAKEGLKVHYIQLDVSNAGSVERMAKTVEDQFDRLDVLINNAGIMATGGQASGVSLDRVKRIMETNFYGAFRTSQALLLMLQRSADGRIINISSGMGAFGDGLGAGYPGYRISKTALNALTFILAAELEDSVKVTSMCPGWVKTDMGGEGAPRTVKEGADTAVWLATAPEVESGKFYRDRKVIAW